MTDIFKSADWAREAERAKAEAAKPDGIIGSDKGLEYVKALFAEATKPHDVNCPTCGAPPGELCREDREGFNGLSTVWLRIVPHAERT